MIIATRMRYFKNKIPQNGIFTQYTLRYKNDKQIKKKDNPDSERGLIFGITLPALWSPFNIRTSHNFVSQST